MRPIAEGNGIMIIRETEDEYVMIAQHDHARLSGEIAQHIRSRFFLDDSFMEDAIFAISEHDRGWIAMDEAPVWNERNDAPSSFLDDPPALKLYWYRRGIDEVEEQNKYAALLCSMHYSSFFQKPSDAEGASFYTGELKRQSRIKAELQGLSEEMISAHFRLLQLCDDISLYVCLNHEGVSKELEHPWYREGFKTSRGLDRLDDRLIQANWLNDKEVALAPSPFEKQFAASLKIKRVSKELIKRSGIVEAYRQSDVKLQEIIFK